MTIPSGKTSFGSKVLNNLQKNKHHMPYVNRDWQRRINNDIHSSSSQKTSIPTPYTYDATVFVL